MPLPVQPMLQSLSQVVAQLALPWQPPLQFSLHSMLHSDPPLQERSQPPASEQSMLQFAWPSQSALQFPAAPQSRSQVEPEAQSRVQSSSVHST